MEYRYNIGYVDIYTFPSKIGNIDVNFQLRFYKLTKEIRLTHINIYKQYWIPLKTKRIKANINNITEVNIDELLK